MLELPLVSPLDRALFLKAQPVFSELDASLLVAIASYATERHFRPGDVLIAEGTPNEELIVLGSGRVRTTWDGRPLWDVEAPGAVGMAHALAGTSLKNGAVALSSGVALAISVENYLQLAEDHFPMMVQVLQVQARLASEAEDTLDWCPGRDEPDAPELLAEEDPQRPLDLVERLIRARRSELFANANLQLLTELFRGNSECLHEKGDTLLRPGEEPEAFHLVVAGNARVAHRNGHCHCYAGPGELLGFTDLFTGESTRWGAVAETPLRTLRVEKALYVDMLEDHFDHALALLEQMASRYIDRRLRLAKLRAGEAAATAAEALGEASG